VPEIDVRMHWARVPKHDQREFAPDLPRRVAFDDIPCGDADARGHHRVDLCVMAEVQLDERREFEISAELDLPWVGAAEESYGFPPSNALLLRIIALRQRIVVVAPGRAVVTVRLDGVRVAELGLLLGE